MQTTETVSFDSEIDGETHEIEVLVTSHVIDNGFKEGAYYDTDYELIGDAPELNLRDLGYVTDIAISRHLESYHE